MVWGLPGGSAVKYPPAIAEDPRVASLIPGSERFPWRRKWQPEPVFLPGESWTEEPGGLQSMGVHGGPWGCPIGHDCVTIYTHTARWYSTETVNLLRGSCASYSGV